MCGRGNPPNRLHSILGLEFLRLGPPMFSHERMVQSRPEPFPSLCDYLHRFRYVIDVKGLRAARWIDRKVCDIDARKCAFRVLSNGHLRLVSDDDSFGGWACARDHKVDLAPHHAYRYIVSPR